MAYNMQNRKPLLTEEQAQFVMDNYLNMSYSEIGEIVGKSGKQIEGWVRNHIPDRIKKQREINDAYFNIIDTPEKAYWLGFIYADGWISKHIHSSKDVHPRFNYEFGMELQRCDEYLLYQLNDALGGKNIIKQVTRELVIVDNNHVTKSESSILRVYSKNIVEDLNSHCIDYNKSSSPIFPMVDLSLFPEYLRGLIDGDGCIHYTKCGNLAVHITGANRACFRYIHDVLLDEYNIDTHIYCEHSDIHLDKYRLYCFRKKDVYSLLHLIYRDMTVPMLIRKYALFANSECLAV